MTRSGRYIVANISREETRNRQREEGEEKQDVQEESSALLSSGESVCRYKSGLAIRPTDRLRVNRYFFKLKLTGATHLDINVPPRLTRRNYREIHGAGSWKEAFIANPGFSGIVKRAWLGANCARRLYFANSNSIAPYKGHV